MDSTRVDVGRREPGDAPSEAAPGQLEAMRWAHRSRSLRALGYDFAVRTSDAALGRHLDRLFAPFGDGGRPAVVYSLFDRGPSAAGRWAGYVNRQRVALTDRASLALAYLLWHVNRGVVEHTTDLVLLHAAGAEWQGAAVVLPAPMDSGKTTTVAGLVRAGMRYLTDEVVAVDPRTLILQPYPKPLTIEAGSWAALADLEPRLEPGLAGYQADQWHVQPASLRADAVATPTAPRLVVSPRFERGAATRLEPVRRADMLQTLVGCTFGGRARAGRHLATLAALLRTCDCYRLTVGDLADACRLIFALFDETETR